MRFVFNKRNKSSDQTPIKTRQKSSKNKTHVSPVPYQCRICAGFLLGRVVAITAIYRAIDEHNRRGMQQPQQPRYLCYQFLEHKFRARRIMLSEETPGSYPRSCSVVPRSSKNEMQTWSFDASRNRFYSTGITSKLVCRETSRMSFVSVKEQGSDRNFFAYLLLTPAL